MKAIVIKEFGSPDVFFKQEVETPKVISGHLLVKVAASSVNPIDTKIRKGAVPSFCPPFPAVLHGDLAGTVVEIGEGVQGFKKGDEVFGLVGGVAGNQGVLSEYALVDARLVALKPKSLSMKQAAALPLVAITAWEAFERAKICLGDQVLVHGGAGGVGHVAIQMAKLYGARVTTTVSSDEKAELARSLGADETVNYKQENVKDYVQRVTGGKGFDVIFDTVGGVNLDQSFFAAKLNGHVASIATRAVHDLTPPYQKGLSLHVVFMLIPLIYNQGREHHGEIMRRVAFLADHGKLKPLLDAETFGFSEVAKAHSKLESGKAMGKIVLVNDL